MAGQRWRQPGRDILRGAARRAGLAVLVGLTLGSLACEGSPVAPRADQPPDGLGRGTSDGGSAAGALVGVWKTTVVVQVPGDLQTWTTTWEFDADQSCREIQVTESLAEGFPRTTERACTWAANGTQMTVTFAGGGTLVMQFSFAGLSPDRLVLDGFEYQRQA